MRTMIAAVLSLSLAFSFPLSSLASEVGAVEPEQGDTANREMKVTYDVTPSYTVTIPTNMEVPFNAEATELGEIRLSDDALLEKSKAVRVTLDTDGTMKNRKDETKTLAYRVTDVSGNDFETVDFIAGSESVALTLRIARSDWDAAASGHYQDSLIFRISYVSAEDENIPETEQESADSPEEAQE